MPRIWEESLGRTVTLHHHEEGCLVDGACDAMVTTLPVAQPDPGPFMYVQAQPLAGWTEPNTPQAPLEHFPGLRAAPMYHALVSNLPT